MLYAEEIGGRGAFSKLIDKPFKSGTNVVQTDSLHDTADMRSLFDFSTGYQCQSDGVLSRLEKEVLVE